MFLTADGPWEDAVASSTFSHPRVRSTGDGRIGPAVGGGETLHLVRNGLPHAVGDDARHVAASQVAARVPPKYARRTSGLFRRSAADPARATRPVSST